ncbi:MAG: uroporphyrinogen-III synthase [Pseudomonadota bacterium]|nr:uroporphyrinogen-III synthase [Pseudomonadota bacterium]
MQGKVVAILESRAGAHLKELVERRGAIGMLAPALEEVPDIDPLALRQVLDAAKSRPFRLAIFQTGVGTRALFEMAASLDCVPELLSMLNAASVVVRGPKPTGELQRRGVRIDFRAATPFTTETILAAVADIPLHAAPVLVQRYGATNTVLRDELEGRGALVREISTYRWSLPADTLPLKSFLAALSAGQVDAVVFTSAVQLENLYQVAAADAETGSLAGLLNRIVVASIGPVCTRALQAHGISPTFEAEPPKLGPLLDGLERALSSESA